MGLFVLGERKNTRLGVAFKKEAETAGVWSGVEVVESKEQGLALVTHGVARLLTNAILPPDWEGPGRISKEGIGLAMAYAPIMLEQNKPGNVGIYFLMYTDEVEKMRNPLSDMGVLVFDALTLKRPDSRDMTRFIKGEEVWGNRSK